MLITAEPFLNCLLYFEAIMFGCFLLTISNIGYLKLIIILTHDEFIRI